MWWSLWGSTPFWFTFINDRYELDDTKAPIVKFIFETYAEWKKWYREIARIIREQYWIKTFTHRRVDFTLQNTLYCGFKSKTWKLSNEEYMIRWYEKPWIYTEEYPLSYITPIISRDLYERCMSIRQWKSKDNLVTKLQEESFKPIFKCTCGRNLRRDDKRWKRYLRCRNYISLTHPPCDQRKCIKLENLNERAWEIINAIIPSQRKLDWLLALINKRLSQWELELKEKKLKSELSLQSHKNKLSEITMSYVDNKISKDIFELSTQTINEAIHKTQWDLLLMEDYNKTITYLELTKQFLYNISEFRTAIDDYEWTKNNFNIEKSSPHFWVLFSTVANCIVDAQSISNYELFEEFGILNYIPSGYMAVPTRLELATSAVTVLRSNQLNYGTMEPDAGFEPATDRLQGGCSTTELIRRIWIQN